MRTNDGRFPFRRGVLCGRWLEELCVGWLEERPLVRAVASRSTAVGNRCSDRAVHRAGAESSSEDGVIRSPRYRAWPSGRYWRFRSVDSACDERTRMLRLCKRRDMERGVPSGSPGSCKPRYTPTVRPRTGAAVSDARRRSSSLPCLELELLAETIMDGVSRRVKKSQELAAVWPDCAEGAGSLRRGGVAHDGSGVRRGGVAHVGSGVRQS
jgi:hypothetical protein